MDKLQKLRDAHEKGTEAIKSRDETDGETHMRHFCEAMQGGRQPPQETMDFVASAFQEIQQGTELKHALKLTKTRGRKQNDSKKWAAEFNAVRAVEKKINEGVNPDDAKQQVADKMGMSYRTVTRYMKNNKSRKRNPSPPGSLTYKLDRLIPKWLQGQK